MAHADANCGTDTGSNGDQFMSKFLSIEHESDVVTVRMNRPETRNALTDPGQMEEFADLCSDLRRVIPHYVVVLPVRDNQVSSMEEIDPVAFAKRRGSVLVLP